jgi:two-component system response regulator HydG
MSRLLVIDDNDTIRDGVAAVGERAGFSVERAASGEAGLEILRHQPCDVVITDLKMDGMDGVEVLRRVNLDHPETVVVIMTAYGTVDNAVEAMRLGAYDYVQKPFSTSDLRLKLERALEWKRLRRAHDYLVETRRLLSERPSEDGTFMGMVGESAAMQRVFRLIEKVAASDTHVHVHGESGTGKELVANAIHRLSARSEGPLVAVNCGAIPENLLESELFGHEKGAFTGAIKRKLGRFELADQGTIFLDEIGELAPSMQVKLLRVLQEREIDRVGGDRPVPVDVRIVSATNRDLKAEVEAGRFREDLYYRLHVVPIHIPPLRERTDDILPLARFFVGRLRARTHASVRAISPEAERALEAYRFPGNVRELENILEQALVFAEGDVLARDDLPPQVAGPATAERPSIPIPSGNVSLNDFLEAAERQMILAAYEAAGGVKTETARRLGIKTSALYYKLEKYGIGTVAGRPSGSRDEPPEDEAEDASPAASDS